MAPRYLKQLAVTGAVLLVSLLAAALGLAWAVWVACVALLVLLGLVMRLGPL
jgi:hypothetical protein